MSTGIVILQTAFAPLRLTTLQFTIQHPALVTFFSIDFP